MPSSAVTIGSRSERVTALSPAPNMSTHGEMGTAAAGSGSPTSRSFMSVDIVSPPPAESPAMVAAAVDRWGGLDVPYSNAGTIRPGTAVELELTGTR